MKYIAQPYYNANQVRIYSLADGSLAATLNLTTPNSGPNCVVLYQDSASVYYLFVSYDLGSSGAVDVYTFSSIGDLTINPPAIGAPTRLTLVNSAVGIAVHPGTGDLYVATFSNVNGAGGVFHYTKSAAGYTFAAQFSSNADGQHNNVAQYCANLAFDLHGNLWMTTFSDSNPTDQFLICYTQVWPAPDSSRFFKFTNGAQIPQASIVKLPGSAQPAPGPLYPLSQPEGIAFDPLGNLWLANNCDDFATSGGGNGTLLRISSAWIESYLQNAGFLGSLNADGYGGTHTLPTDPADLTAYYYYDARFGGLCFDGYTLYANDQNAGGDATNAVVWAVNSSNPAAGFTAIGVTTTYPGNGTMAIFNTTPASLLIRDYPTDIGTVPPPPFPAGDVAWESCDIGLSTQSNLIASVPLPSGAWSASDMSTPALQSDGTINIAPGVPAYVYVKVANTSNVASTGTEVLKLYWAKGSVNLDWPQPWDGSVYASGVPLGGPIGAMTLPVIPALSQTYVMMEWYQVPIPADYSVDVNHFCLLARIESSSLYPFGMWQPEQAGATSTQVPLVNNVINNHTIGWRNVAIVTPSHPHKLPPERYPQVRMGILGANYASTPARFSFAVQTLARNGRPAEIPARMEVHVEGPALHRLRETEFHEQRFTYLGDGRFHLQDPRRGMENIHLHPHETLPFTLELTPEEDVRDFAVRVIQYIHSGDSVRMVGGQTFVVGSVEGFPYREHRRCD